MFPQIQGLVWKDFKAKNFQLKLTDRNNQDFRARHASHICDALHYGVNKPNTEKPMGKESNEFSINSTRSQFIPVCDYFFSNGIHFV